MDTITTIQSLLKSNGSARPVTVALTPNEIRLIAAAPELLEACQAVLDWATRECMPQGGKNDGPWEMIEAALLKVKGD